MIRSMLARAVLGYGRPEPAPTTPAAPEPTPAPTPVGRIAVAPTAAPKPRLGRKPIPAAPDANPEARGIAHTLLIDVVDAIENEVRIMRSVGRPDGDIKAWLAASERVLDAAARLTTPGAQP